MKSTFKILLLYKNSTYANYFLSGVKHSKEIQGMLRSHQGGRFKKTHDAHFNSLFRVEEILLSLGLKYTKVRRGSRVDYGRFNLVITVGGDGTFLEAARQIKDAMILGVNSDPRWSVGNFCCADSNNFQHILQQALATSPRVRLYQRLMLKLGADKLVNVLNDILVCHSNPAAISRYCLAIGAQKEEQRSSGLWVSTAVGSSAAMRSAGGQVLPVQDKSFQYRPRELYSWKGRDYLLKGGVLPLKQSIKITSLMREGVIYVDGAHYKLPFSFGATARLSISKHPLKVVWS